LCARERETIIYGERLRELEKQKKDKKEMVTTQEKGRRHCYNRCLEIKTKERMRNKHTGEVCEKGPIKSENKKHMLQYK